jgi:hypothetical protein
MKKFKLIIIIVFVCFLGGTLFANSSLASQDNNIFVNKNGTKDKVTTSIDVKDAQEKKDKIAFMKSEGWSLESATKNPDGTTTLVFYKYNKFSTSVNNSPTSVNKDLTLEELLKMSPSDKFPDGEYISETTQGVTVSEYKDGILIKRTTNGREVDVTTLKYK